MIAVKAVGVSGAKRTSRRPSSSSAVVAVLLGILVWSGDALHGASGKGESILDSNDAKALLQQAALEQAAVYDRIRTWKGEARLDEVSIKHKIRIPVNGPLPRIGQPRPQALFKEETGNFVGQRQVRATFLFDADRRSMVSCFKALGPMEWRRRDSREMIRREERRVFMKTLSRPDGLYLLEPEDLVGDLQPFGESAIAPSPATKVVRLESPARFHTLRQYASVFDPSITFEIGERRLDQLMTSAAKALDNPDLWYTTHVARSPDGKRLIVERIYRAGPRGQSLLRVELDATKHFLPSHATQTLDDKPFLEFTWSYQPSGDLLVPATYMLRLYEAGELNFERKARFVNNQLNLPVAETEFGIATALELKDGDRMIDSISGRLMKFKNGSTIPLSERSP